MLLSAMLPALVDFSPLLLMLFDAAYYAEPCYMRLMPHTLAAMPLRDTPFMPRLSDIVVTR